MNKKRFFSFLGFLTLGLVILYVVYARQQAAYLTECAVKGISESDCSLINKIGQDLNDAKWPYFIAAIGFFILSNVLRALRWSLLTEPMGYPLRFINSFAAVNIGYFTNMALPRIGELIRAGVISRYEGISTEKAFGTIITERVIDMIIFLLVSLLALVVAFKKVSEYLIAKGQLNASQFIILGIIGLVGIAAIYLLIKNKDRIGRTAFGGKVMHFLTGLGDGLTSIAKLKHKFLFVAYSLGVWVCYFFVTYIPFRGMDVTMDLPMEAGLVTLFLGSVGMVIPSPGGMGTYQFMVSESLSLYGVSGVDGFSFANLNFFFVSVLGNIIVGLLSYIILPLYNKK